MTSATVAFGDVSAFDGRDLLRSGTRAVMRTVGVGVGTLAVIGVSTVATTLAAAWLFSIVMAASPHGKSSIGPGVYALDKRFDANPRAAGGARPYPLLTLATPEQRRAEIEREMAGPALAELKAEPEPVSLARPAQRPTAPPRVAQAPKPVVEQAERIPLPRAHPARQELAQLEPPRQEPAPPVAAAASMPQVAKAAPAQLPLPPMPKPVLPQTAHNKALALPGADSRTAVYDISARTVYMPNGTKLEAHSGLGEKMDDPRYVHVRMRGATPPNVYNLALREQLFHGVQAIRLKPVDENKMFGRDGILAHTYMLGPNGQSNGCVSFKDYDKFLNAYLDGHVDRLVVVTHLDDNTSIPMARGPRNNTGRYAAAELRDPAKMW